MSEFIHQFDINRSLHILEFNKILKLISDLAHTEGAKTKILTIVPSTDPERVKIMQRQTSEAKMLASKKGAPVFNSVKDIADSVERAVKGAALSPKELLEIANIYRTARGILNYHKTDKTVETSIDQIFERLFANRPLEDKIYHAIVSEDIIADEASPELSDIRRKIRVANAKVKENLQKYVTSDQYSKFLQESIVTMRNGRYVIPVKTEYKNEIKGLVHDTSSSGSTLFIEPLAVVETNNELKILERREKDEIERILLELSSYCADFETELLLNYQNITELAVLFAKSEYSFRIDGVEPKISDEKKIWLHRARHPLLDKNTVVPIDIGVGGTGVGNADAFDTLIITGPNTGGKTVALKTLGLFVLMAQAGIHLPCNDDSYVSVFDAALPDIGDEQSIEQSLSTFSAHMVNIVSILNSLTPNCLVLFDELGAGTDPVEGAALAVAILEQVHKTGALCVATTHYAELKTYAIETPHAKNASCEFDVNSLRPTYKLVIGMPGRSNAFAISQKLGLSSEIISNAKTIISSESRKFENILEKLDEERTKYSEEARKAEKIRLDMEKSVREREKALQAKSAEINKSIEKAKEEAKQILSSAKATSNYVFAELDKLQKQKEAENFAQALKEMKTTLKFNIKNSERKLYTEDTSVKISDNYTLPRPLVKGDEVYLVDLELKGVVENETEDRDGNILISSGIVKVKSKLNNIRLLADVGLEMKTPAKPNRAIGARNVKTTSDIKTVKNEIDLRGQNGEDAWLAVDKFIDDSKMSGLNEVRLIHGKGTGALKNALWQFLRTDKRIGNYRLGRYGEGDSGVTVIELK